MTAWLNYKYPMLMLRRSGCMVIRYTCKHCQQTIGTMRRETLDRLKDRNADILSGLTDDVLFQHEALFTPIQVICEDCEQTLRDHPHYHELDHFIQ